VDGAQGRLFSVADSLTGSLMSVNDIAGLPILEVLDTDTVIAGSYNTNAFIVSGTRIGISTRPFDTSKLGVSGNVSVIGSISSNAVIYASGGNSNQWNSNYTTTNTNSGQWSGAYTSFNANSSFYDATVNELFTYVISETGDEFITEDSLLMVDSNIDGYPAWNSTTDTVYNLSAGWENTRNIVANNASNWTSTYTSVCANSANWSAAYTNLVNNSATYLSWSSVSASYALGSQYVKLSGDTMTGPLTINNTTNPALIVGNGNTGYIKIGDGTFSKIAGSGWVLDNLRVSGGNYQNGITFQTGGVNAGLWSAGTGILSFSNNITESMRLNASGNLGIGTTAPTERLTVVGNISASGNLATNTNYVVTAALTANLTMPSAADTLLPLSAKNDPNGWFSNTTRRFTPTVPGYYHVDYQVSWQPGTAGSGNQNNIQILKSGTAISLAQQPINSSNVNTTQNTATVVYLNGSTDYLTFQAYSSNAAQVITGETNGTWTKADIFKIN